MEIVVAVTGASGAVLAERLLESLEGHKTHLIVSAGALAVAEYEGAGIDAMGELADFVWDEADMGSPLASSSNPVDAMVVVPCSMKSLSAMANGYADNLVSRCAENVLKMGRRLVVVPRDTPLSLSALDNMRQLKLSGAIILPPNVGYYHKPESVDDMTDFVVGKILDSLGIGHSLYRRWGGD